MPTLPPSPEKTIATTPAGNNVKTSTETILSTMPTPTPTVQGQPTETGKNVTSGPVETSGGEGKEGSVVKIMVVALLGTLGVFVLA